MTKKECVKTVWRTIFRIHKENIRFYAMRFVTFFFMKSKEYESFLLFFLF